MHIQMRTVKPILYGSVAALALFNVNYNDTGITAGVKKVRLHASAAKPILVEFFAEVTTAFNGATTNILTVGSDSILTNQFMAAGDITEGTAAFYPTTAVPLRYRLVADTDVYIKYNAGVQATGTLTSDNTNVADGATVTIGDPAIFTKTYTFKTALTPTEGEVLIGADADASLLNLIRAINHSGTAGTDYSAAAAHKTVTAATSVTAHAFAVTAINGGTAGNSIATTETSTHLSWGGVLLTGGTTGAPSAGAAIIYMRITELFPNPTNVLGALA